MSWPADGKPRFVVTTIAGEQIFPDGKSRRRGYHGPNREFYVLDRANCHRAVLTVPSSRSLTPSRAERIAARVAEGLNAA